MTTQEAIEELKKVDTLDMSPRLCEAYYMSIRALENKSTSEEQYRDFCEFANFALHGIIGLILVAIAMYVVIMTVM